MWITLGILAGVLAVTLCISAAVCNSREMSAEGANAPATPDGPGRQTATAEQPSVKTEENKGKDTGSRTSAGKNTEGGSSDAEKKKGSTAGTEKKEGKAEEKKTAAAGAAASASNIEGNGSAGDSEAGGNGSSRESSSGEGNGSENDDSTGEASHTHNWVPQTVTVHHDAESSQVYVVDQEAYDEPVYEDQPVYETYGVYICNVCGAEIGSSTAEIGAHGDLHTDWETMTSDFSYHSEQRQRQTGTQTVQTGTQHHEEQGHYETRVTREAWDEQVVTGYVCSGCGACR